MWISDGQRSGIVRGFCWVLMLGALLPSLSGCNSNSGGGPRAKRAPGAKMSPDEIVGRWKLQSVQVPVEVDFVILDISHDGKKYAVKLIGTEKFPAPLTLKSTDINDDGQVRLEIGVGADIGWSFQGKLDGENIWGTLMVPQFQLVPAKMERTELSEIDVSKEPERISTLGDFLGARNAADKYVAMDEFVKRKESNRSPLLIEGYALLANQLKAENIPLDKVKEFIGEYRKAIEVWGPRIAPRVDLEVGRALASQKLFPELARELLTQAGKEITADYPLEWKAMLAEGWVTAGDYEQGLKLLQPLRELDEANPMLRMVYARAKEQAKDVDEAIKTYAGLAVLPQFEQTMVRQRASQPELTLPLILPSEATARLWKQKHGNTKGLDDYLQKSYDEEMKRFVLKRTPGEPLAKERVVLMELFTGASCGPCIPADIACESFRAAYSPQELIVIKYHQHSPAPDPLCDEPLMRRFEFYDGRGTPTLIINGQSVENAGGLPEHASSLISHLKTGVDPMLKETSPVEVKVSASRKGDDIAIKASVEGITTTDNDPRLILVLVENGIKFHAPNGIRVHNCVARGFAEGPTGIKLKPGEIDHEGKISVAKLKANLKAHLKQFEDQAGRPFPAKPMEFAQLQVVAIVQNQITKSYMQSAITDVVEAQP